MLPSGTGNTLPFSCFANDTDREIGFARKPLSSNTSDTSLGTTWAIQSTLAENCYNNARDKGELIGTAFTARDMMQIVDALQVFAPDASSCTGFYPRLTR